MKTEIKGALSTWHMKGSYADQQPEIVITLFLYEANFREVHDLMGKQIRMVLEEVDDE